MIKIQPSKLVLFGAGKIGRSFIAQLFSRAGYSTVFIDVNAQLIQALNKQGQYPVYIYDQHPETIIVNNVSGICFSDKKSCIEAIAQAGILATSVGKKALPAILPYIAEGLMLRRKKFDDHPLDIIIAENMRHADRYFKEELTKLLPENYNLDDWVGLVETSIGKMAPIIPIEIEKEEPLAVYAEAYNTLVLDGEAFKNNIPSVPGLAPKRNIKAWVDRKIFLHNLGHAATAYLGFQKYPEIQSIKEILDDHELKGEIQETMEESAHILLNLHFPEFSKKDLLLHIQDLLQRFVNPVLGDTVFRVGCDLKRKLGPEDRIMIPIRTAENLELSSNHLLKTLISGYLFRTSQFDPTAYPEDEKIFLTFKTNPEKALTIYSGLHPKKDRDLIIKALSYVGSMK